MRENSLPAAGGKHAVTLVLEDNPNKTLEFRSNLAAREYLGATQGPWERIKRSGESANGWRVQSMLFGRNLGNNLRVADSTMADASLKRGHSAATEDQSRPATPPRTAKPMAPVPTPFSPYTITSSNRCTPAPTLSVQPAATALSQDMARDRRSPNPAQTSPTSTTPTVIADGKTTTPILSAKSVAMAKQAARSLCQ